jgi:hypothetical protein
MPSVSAPSAKLNVRKTLRKSTGVSEGVTSIFRVEKEVEHESRVKQVATACYMVLRNVGRLATNFKVLYPGTYLPLSEPQILRKNFIRKT